MKQLRNWIPIFGILSLFALFLKLPEIPNTLGVFKCTKCISNNPYLVFAGAGYFAILIAASLLFPYFPGKRMARAGLVWAILLALALTYLNLPHFCMACAICHVCNILIWTIWVFVPSNGKNVSSKITGQQACLLLFVPISVVALFSCFNLTFMAYGAKNIPLLQTSLKIGDPAPTFLPSASNALKGTIINFISPECHYCKQQLNILNNVAKQVADGSYRFINISPALSSELMQYLPSSEWIEDKDQTLHKLFRVSGYPSMFILKSDGKIGQIILGLPDQLKASLLANLD